MENSILKNWKEIWLLLLLSVATASSVFAQGQERGNGTDDIDDSGKMAWLVGQPGDSFKYCVQIAPGFQYDSKRFKVRLDRALKGWEEYFKTAKVLDALIQKGYPIPLTSAVEVSCSSEKNMTFYLGQEDAIVSVIKKQYRNPTAFAFRTEYEIGKTGKGMIWFAMPGSVYPNKKKANETIAFPNWIENDEVFDMFLIHELGHTYGIPHVEGTIMDERLSKIVADLGLERRQIEWTRELISFYPKAQKVDLSVSILEGDFVGIRGISKYKSAFFKSEIVKKQYYVGMLTAEDFDGNKSDILNVKFEIPAGEVVHARYESIACFSAIKLYGEANLCFSNAIMSMNGTAQDLQGNVYPALMEYNYGRITTDLNRTTADPYVLKIFRNGKWEIFFEAGRSL